MKYVENSLTKLENLKNGITKHTDKWQNQPAGLTDVEAAITEIAAKKKEVDDAKDLLAVKQTEMHGVVNQNDPLIEKITNLTLGIEADTPQNLIDYGIETRKPYSKKSAPVENIHPAVKDDTDGIGFILTTTADKNAEYYEWQKGVGASAEEVPVPELKMYKTTTKTTFVDDDVAKAIRYFYRVRAANASGFGPWSEIVSRVQ